jgi:hypothetical protein
MNLMQVYDEAHRHMQRIWRTQIEDAAGERESLELLFGESDAQLKAFAARVREAVQGDMIDYAARNAKVEPVMQMIVNASTVPAPLPAGFVDNDHDGMA